MFKFAFGVAVGYIFSDVIEETIEAVKKGMNKARTEEPEAPAAPEAPTT